LNLLRMNCLMRNYFFYRLWLILNLVILWLILIVKVLAKVLWSIGFLLFFVREAAWREVMMIWSRLWVVKVNKGNLKGKIYSNRHITKKLKSFNKIHKKIHIQVTELQNKIKLILKLMSLKKYNKMKLKLQEV